LAQKRELFVPTFPNLAVANMAVNHRDLGFLAALAMLIVWAIGTFALNAPGWIHLLLTLGVFLLIWRIVVAGTRDTKTGMRDAGRAGRGDRGA